MTSTSAVTTKLDPELALVFAPLDKRAMGLALGVLGGALLGGATLLSLLVDPQRTFPLYLLSQIFPGYEVSARGALIGAGWACFTGFVWGWFLAFMRNLVMAAWLLGVRVRADLTASRSLLDHI